MSEMNASSRSILIKLGITVAGFVFVLILIEGGFKGKTKPGQTVLTASAPTAPKTVPVVRLEGGDTRVWPATITALKVITIAPAINGRILELPIRSGQQVKRGQLIARIDHPGLDARVAQARSELRATEAEAQRARADAHRLRNLFDREAATRQALETAEAQETQAGAMVVKARDGVREAAAQLAETRLLAPFDGTIDVRHQELGDMAMPGQPILTLLQSGSLRVAANIPDLCSHAIQIGAPLTIRTASSGPIPNALVDEIVPSEDPTTHTLLIKATLPMVDGKGIRPGSFATVTLACGTLNSLAIPVEAIHRNGQLEMVHIIKEGKPVIRLVRTGRKIGPHIEILSGLEEGDRVVMDRDEP